MTTIPARNHRIRTLEAQLETLRAEREAELQRYIKACDWIAQRERAAQAELRTLLFEELTK